MTKEDGDVGAFGRHVGGDGGDVVDKWPEAVSPTKPNRGKPKDTSVSFNAFGGGRNRRHLEASESIEAVRFAFEGRED
jgi:hypothetical protein